MALYVVFCHLKPWFTAPLVWSAASNDLAMYRSLIDFIKIDKKAADLCCKKLNRHTWYLTEELIPLTLFNEEIALETRTEIATEIHNHKSDIKLTIKKPNLPTLQATSELVDFVGPRSKILFELLNSQSTYGFPSSERLEPHSWICCSQKEYTELICNQRFSRKVYLSHDRLQHEDYARWEVLPRSTTGCWSP